MSSSDLSEDMTEIRFAIVNPDDGDVLRIGVCSAQSLDLQGEEGGILIHPVPDSVSDLTHFWDGQQFLTYPTPQPSSLHKWQNGQWVDGRTVEQLEAEAFADLQARRAGASLTRLEFAKRVSHPETGIILPSSGMILLDGDVPPELQPMVAGLSPADQFDLIMDLKGASQFDRLNPFVIAAGHYLGLTDEQIDAVFGI